VLLGNNWSLRRAGLKGFKVEASFDGEALCLAGRRKGELRVPAAEIEQMLVGYEKGRFDCTWRTIIWSPLTRRGLVLATTRRRNAGFVQLIETLGRAMKRAGRLDRVQTGQRMGDALFMPILAFVILGLMIYGLFFEPGYSTPRTPEAAQQRLWILGLGIFLVVLAVWDFVATTRPRVVTRLSQLQAYLPGI
jgi:hypothetical protein